MMEISICINDVTYCLDNLRDWMAPDYKPRGLANIGNKIELGLTGDLELHFVATDLNLKRAWARISDFKPTLADIHLGVQANRLAAYRGHGV